MFDIEIRLATCRVVCGAEAGTGFLVSADHVVTARHCVLAAIDGDATIVLTFPVIGQDPVDVLATVLAGDASLDICLLALQTPVDATPLALAAGRPLEGAEWVSFGFPSSKPLVGHRIAGAVETVHDAPIAKVDTDLSIAPASALQSYRGLSGGAVVIRGFVFGVLRLRMDNSLGAISVRALSSFLESHDVPILAASQSSDDTTDVATRVAFQTTFESLIQNSSGRYVFLEGAHGIGKTTFSRHFAPLVQQLLHVGTFSVRDSAASPIAVNSQPSALYDWLVATISNLLVGRPERQTAKNYAAMATDTEIMLSRCGQYCAGQNKIGVLFIDGLNDVASISEERLKLFVGLLPSTLPRNVCIVFVAPNFAAVANAIDSRVLSANRTSLPPLPVESSRHFVQRHISDTRAHDYAFVNALVDKAAGHPLYLHYLIRYANQNPSDARLDAFPALDGPIEEYYERLWQGLLSDPHVVNLLALISRLRQPLPVKDLFRLLEPHEQAVFYPTVSRIEHLFFERDYTSIYHDSFRTFLVQRTEAAHDTLCERLAAFCLEHDDLPYCVLNRVHHLLASNVTHQRQATHVCQQEWVDACVLLSVQPDVLLDDLHATLGAALTSGCAVESIRLLLLVQRVRFRYDSLFAQSAGLVAKALVALGRPADALQHVLRYNKLIVSVPEALHIAWLMIDAECEEEAVRLLNITTDTCVDLYSRTEMEVTTFAELAFSHLLGILFLRVSGRRQLRYFAFAQQRLTGMLAQSLDGAEPAFLEFNARRFAGVPNLYFLTFKDTYSSNDDLQSLGLMQEVPRRRLLAMRLDQLVDQLDYSDRFELPCARDSHATLLADIESTIKAGERLQRPDIDFVVDALIRAGASAPLVRQVAEDNEISDPDNTSIRDDNGVDANNRAAHRSNMLWRIRAFTDESIESPVFHVPTRDNWEEVIQRLFEGLGVLEGKARRALVSDDAADLDKLWTQLRQELLTTIELTLGRRARWKRSYAIPETALPFLLTLVAEVVESCFASHMPEYLEWVLERCPHQLGIYSEGFRNSLYHLIERASRDIVADDVRLLLCELAAVLRRHAVECVENRHELVPELLRLIPLCVRLGAIEGANAIYEEALKVSMGPTWYKEDQFGLMATALRAIPSNSDAAGYFPAVAGLLERASGEITFQRFVRQQKSGFVGLLASRQEIKAAAWYFKSQTCGGPSQLLKEIGGSEVDRAGPFSGNRHPGGALDEQDAILRFVKAARVDWRLRWALLEVCQIGNYRHTESFASAFAALFNESANDPDILGKMTDRFSYVVQSDLTDTQAHTFVSAFVASLDESIAERFATLAAQFPNSNHGAAAPAPLPARMKENKRARGEAQGMDSDDLFLPGVFGRSDAFDGAESALNEEREHIVVGNVRLAHETLIAMLRHVQESKWSIWQGPHASTTAAVALLRRSARSAKELVTCYRDLVLDEQHAASWVLAEHLVTETANMVGPDEAIAIMDVVLDHIRLMVGTSEGHITPYEPLRNMNEPHVDIEVLRFIEWFEGHPKWIRREKAAEVLAWLATQWEPCVRYLSASINVPSLMHDRSIGLGVLEILSREDPLGVWQHVNSDLDVARLLREEPHAYRVCTLYSIASRAADAGSETAANAVLQLAGMFRTGGIESSEAIVLPNWAHCIRREWSDLERLGIASQSLFNKCESMLAAACAPHTSEVVHALEDAVLTTFSEPKTRSFSRWHARVSYALNCALTPYLAIEDVDSARQILSPVNPCAPCLLRDPTFVSQFGDIYKAIMNREYAGVVQDACTFRLHYLEYGEIESRSPLGADSPETHSIEIVAFIVAAAETRRGFFLPEIAATFSSRELPPREGEEHETCATVNPTFEYLGSFTPGVPLDAFLRRASATHADCSERTWRIGRSGAFDYFGRPIHEGCSLSIARNAVQFKEELKLAWIIFIDDQVVAMIDAEGNELF